MNINFKGYGACPLKALHLQMPSYFDQKNTVLDAAVELEEIAKQENFDVFIHANGDLYSGNQAGDLTTYKFPEYQNVRPFIQDMRLFLPNEKLGIFKNTRRPQIAESERKESEKFVKAVNRNPLELSMLTEGGNLFIGKKDNGEKYLLIGDTPIRRSSEVLSEEWDKADLQAKKQLGKGAIEKIAKETGIKPDNIYMISQSPDFSPALAERLPPDFQMDFHIDMVVRPLKYPYVLVNDPSRIDIENSGMNRFLWQKQVENIRRGRLTSPEKIMDELKAQGFVPIPVPGIINEKNANYTNAIVHERPNGELVYITNSASGHQKDIGSNLDNLFKSYIEKNVSGIKEIKFVKNHLLDKLGGIHCMTLEEPDFEKWA